MPVIVARKINNSGAGDIKRDIVIVRELIQEMAGISAFIATSPIVCAPHIGTSANALVRPFIPLTVSIEADGNHRRLFSHCSIGILQWQKAQWQKQSPPQEE